MLASQVKQLQFFAQARKYGSAMEASLDATNVPTSVYTNLIEAVHKNLDKMYRYVDLRKSSSAWTSCICTTCTARSLRA